MSDITSRVKAIIVDKLGVDENEVTLEANFTNDLGADSLDTVELIMEFEKEFDLRRLRNIARRRQGQTWHNQRRHRLAAGAQYQHCLLPCGAPPARR